MSKRDIVWYQRKETWDVGQTPNDEYLVVQLAPALRQELVDTSYH